VASISALTCKSACRLEESNQSSQTPTNWVSHPSGIGYRDTDREISAIVALLSGVRAIKVIDSLPMEVIDGTSIWAVLWVPTALSPGCSLGAGNDREVA
jgi:hypothetical protein